MIMGACIDPRNNPSLSTRGNISQFSSSSKLPLTTRGILMSTFMTFLMSIWTTSSRFSWKSASSCSRLLDWSPAWLAASAASISLRRCAIWFSNSLAFCSLNSAHSACASDLIDSSLDYLWKLGHVPTYLAFSALRIYSLTSFSAIMSFSTLGCMTNN